MEAEQEYYQINISGLSRYRGGFFVFVIAMWGLALFKWPYPMWLEVKFLSLILAAIILWRTHRQLGRESQLWSVYPSGKVVIGEQALSISKVSFVTPFAVYVKTCHPLGQSCWHWLLKDQLDIDGFSRMARVINRLRHSS